jgi:hypothetical protein
MRESGDVGSYHLALLVGVWPFGDGRMGRLNGSEFDIIIDNNRILLSHLDGGDLKGSVILRAQIIKLGAEEIFHFFLSILSLFKVLLYILKFSA